MGEYLHEFGYYFSADNTRNQYGLLTTYSSLNTDFDAYIASNPLHDPFSGDAIWGSLEGVRSGNFNFALGGTYIVDAMAFWNLFDSDSAIRRFNLLLADNPSFDHATTVGTFTALNSLGSSNGITTTAAQIFSFSRMSASFVRIQILDTWSSSSFFAGFSEAAFRVSEVPEPATFVLIAIGLSCIMGWRFTVGRALANGWASIPS
jgi:hypothetical protein